MKRYPFNLRKHAHDLDYRRNRAKNERSEKEDAGTLTETEKRKYKKLIDGLAEILIAWPDNRGIVWITGEQYGLAQESIAWAESMRGR